MRTLALLLILLADASAIAADDPAPTEGDFVLRDFHFASGEILPELRLHYRTLSEPRRDGHGSVRGDDPGDAGDGLGLGAEGPLVGDGDGDAEGELADRAAGEAAAAGVGVVPVAREGEVVGIDLLDGDAAFDLGLRKGAWPRDSLAGWPAETHLACRPGSPSITTRCSRSALPCWRLS